MYYVKSELLEELDFIILSPGIQLSFSFCTAGKAFETAVGNCACLVTRAENIKLLMTSVTLDPGQ
jgi:hypothetical protein